MSFDSSDSVMGVFRYCTNEKIPADSLAIHKAFYKLSQLHPEFFKRCKFDHDGISEEIDSHISGLILNDMLGILGPHLETIKISPTLTETFDADHASKFNTKQINDLKKMGLVLPDLLRKHESTRYKRLTTVD
jgi:hypothetical protein